MRNSGGKQAPIHDLKWLALILSAMAGFAVGVVAIRLINAIADALRTLCGEGLAEIFA